MRSMGVISARRDTFLCMTFFEIWLDRNSNPECNFVNSLEHSSSSSRTLRLFLVSFPSMSYMDWILFVVSISRRSAI